MVKSLRNQKNEWPITRLVRRLAIVVAVLLCVGRLPMGLAAPLPVELTKLDGTTETVDWLGCKNDGTIHIQMESTQHRLPWDDLLHLAFHEGSINKEPAALARFFLPTDGMFRGAVAAAGQDTVKAQTSFAGLLTIPFDKLAGIAIASATDYSQANAAFQKVLAARQVGSDVLITRSTDNVKTLRGRLIELGPDGCAFEFAGRTRTLGIDKIFGVVFALGTETTSHAESTFELVDGSSFAATPIACADDHFELETAFAGRLHIEAEQVLGVLVSSPRLEYISDLAIVNRRTEGMLHGDWPIQFDKSVAGGVLSIDGRIFRRGLGVHSLTKIDYDIDAAFETFVAVIGIDDEVRPRGDVVFQVLGDDRVLFDSGSVNGHETGRHIRVDVKGVNKLTLLVEFGEGLDLADHADWANARLIRPARSIRTRTTTQ